MDFPPIPDNFCGIDSASFDFDDFDFGVDGAKVVESSMGTSTTIGAT